MLSHNWRQVQWTANLYSIHTHTVTCTHRHTHTHTYTQTHTHTHTDTHTTTQYIAMSWCNIWWCNHIIKSHIKDALWPHSVLSSDIWRRQNVNFTAVQCFLQIQVRCVVISWIKFMRCNRWNVTSNFTRDLITVRPSWNVFEERCHLYQQTYDGNVSILISANNILVGIRRSLASFLSWPLQTHCLPSARI